MAREPVRAGINGLGRSGWDIHANALADHSGFRVVAVSDPVAERRQEATERFACAAYAEPDGLVADGSVDVVIVATPSHTHAALAIAALRAGKHVVVEKPMAQTVAEMDAMLAAAEQTGRILTCFQPRRLDAEFIAIREVIASGRLGRLVMIRRGHYRFTRRADWQMLRKYGGGELSNTGPHLLDQVLVLLGPGPVEMFADLQHTVGAGDAEDHVKLCLRTPTGVVADIEISLCAAFPQPEWLILGTTGGLRGSRNELAVKWFDPATVGALTLDEGPAPGRKYGTGEQIAWHEETLHPQQTRSPALLFYDKLQASVQEDAPLFVTAQSIRPQIEIIERARAQTGLR